MLFTFNIIYINLEICVAKKLKVLRHSKELLFGKKIEVLALGKENLKKIEVLTHSEELLLKKSKS